MRVENHSAANLSTRRWLRGLVADGDLDEPCYALALRVLEKCLPGTFSGWIFELSEALGARREDALEAASLTELIYAAVDFADDLEDGDSGVYFADVALPLQTNLSHQLLALALARAAELEARLKRPGLARACGRALCAAACGQHAELLRERWSVAAYARAMELMGGRQFECYLRAAAAAANCAEGLLEPMAPPLAILLLTKYDESAADSRMLALPRAEIEGMRCQAEHRLNEILETLPRDARPVAARLTTFAAERHGGEEEN